MGYRKYSSSLIDKRERLGIPTPGTDINSVITSIRALKTAVDQMARQRGSIMESVVTVGDLIRLGLITSDQIYELEQGGSIPEVRKQDIPDRG